MRVGKPAETIILRSQRGKKLLSRGKMRRREVPVPSPLRAHVLHTQGGGETHEVSCFTYFQYSTKELFLLHDARPPREISLEAGENNEGNSENSF